MKHAIRLRGRVTYTEAENPFVSITLTKAGDASPSQFWGCQSLRYKNGVGRWGVTFERLEKAEWYIAYIVIKTGGQNGTERLVIRRAFRTDKRDP